VTNFEIKVKIEDVGKIQNIIMKSGAVYQNDIRQIDCYLKTGTNKEKIREAE
jgi:hypothetical protein